ncbi:hypothetical protein yc1106_01169 [Curvularia clavata]|uniref:Uncharacterized protein n=1 Tax=Curvularia clavata TaxID=95742 RepID=A0A9Q8Z2D0_CURCL|nr:hypothetical protein yc1106_01169 [Curvularia clavata]
MAPLHRTSPSASLWDPPDDEWAELGASRIARTFIASFRDPTQPTPNNSPKKDQSALCRLTDTLASLLSLRSIPTEAEAEEETPHTQLSKLQNPYYTSPTHDLCDKIMRPFFLRGSRFFRNNTWPRHMHVIDLAAYFASEDALVQAASPRLCDAVATVLSHTSEECVEAFLDPRVGEFVYKREVEGRKGGNVVIVRREGNNIFAGCYRDSGFSLQWSLYVRARFNVLGEWFDEFASPRPGTTPVVDGCVRWSGFMPLRATSAESKGPGSEPRTACQDGGGQATPRRIALSEWKDKDDKEAEWESDGVSSYDVKFALYQSRALARYLVWDIWYRLERRYDCKALWEADGDVEEVRLMTSLVGFDHDED